MRAYIDAPRAVPLSDIPSSSVAIRAGADSPIEIRIQGLDVPDEPVVSLKAVHDFLPHHVPELDASVIASGDHLLAVVRHRQRRHGHPVAHRDGAVLTTDFKLRVIVQRGGRVNLWFSEFIHGGILSGGLVSVATVVVPVLDDLTAISDPLWQSIQPHSPVVAGQTQDPRLRVHERLGARPFLPYDFQHRLETVPSTPMQGTLVTLWSPPTLVRVLLPRHRPTSQNVHTALPRSARNLRRPRQLVQTQHALQQETGAKSVGWQSITGARNHHHDTYRPRNLLLRERLHVHTLRNPRFAPTARPPLVPPRRLKLPHDLLHRRPPRRQPHLDLPTRISFRCTTIPQTDTTMYVRARADCPLRERCPQKTRPKHTPHVPRQYHRRLSRQIPRLPTPLLMPPAPILAIPRYIRQRGRRVDALLRNQTVVIVRKVLRV